MSAKILVELKDVNAILEHLRDKCGNEEMAFALNWAQACVGGLPRAAEWIRAADKLPTDIPDDFVLGVVTGKGKNVIYQDAVCLVGYDEKTGWYLEEDPTIDVTVSWWMQIPDPPEEGKT